MCGIAGYIGVSKNSQLTFKLATRLFERLESRGTDASGFYGSEGDTIHYHKQPLRSAVYVRSDPWKKLHDKRCEMLIMHARGASQGMGAPEDNRNNHPFLNQEQTLALIHNGRITDAEYTALRKKYEVESGCDSEILIRIVAGADAKKAAEKFPEEKPEVALRLMGLKDVFSFINHGHMAAVVAENIPEQKCLWLFRNEHRPLWVADTRDSLGQIWFCSTPEIWTAAVNAIPDLRRVPGFSKHKLYDLTPKEVWMFSLEAEQDIQYRRFAVSQQAAVPWQHDGTKVHIAGTVQDRKESEFSAAMALLRETMADIDSEWTKIEAENSISPQGCEEFLTRLHNINQDLQAVRQDLEH